MKHSSSELSIHVRVAVASMRHPSFLAPTGARIKPKFKAGDVHRPINPQIGDEK
jgi:hypothetical protein